MQEVTSISLVIGYCTNDTWIIDGEFFVRAKILEQFGILATF
jgi:hypothetical protein